VAKPSTYLRSSNRITDWSKAAPALSFPRKREATCAVAFLDPRPRSGRGQALRGGDRGGPYATILVAVLLGVPAGGLRPCAGDAQNSSSGAAVTRSRAEIESLIDQEVSDGTHQLSGM